jgi:hypothetical protein
MSFHEHYAENGLGSSKLAKLTARDRSHHGGAMNTQHQPEWEALIRRNRKAGKSKRFASSMILVGVITLIGTFALIFLLAILTNFGDFHYSLGEATEEWAIVTIAAGFIGVVFLVIGYTRQVNANYELGEVEKERRALKLQIKADEENSWPGTPAT